jgi:hypothetical protein
LTATVRATHNMHSIRRNVSTDALGDKLVTLCGNSGCPTIYEPGDGMLVVQGYVVEGVEGLPVGESAVRIPVALLRDAVRALEE